MMIRISKLSWRRCLRNTTPVKDTISSNNFGGLVSSRPLLYFYVWYLEADRYAANRTSESALKKGIRQIYKQDAKNFNKKYDKINKNNPDKLKDKEERNKARRYEANQRTEDYEHRSKVLKNKDMRSAKTYK